MKKLESLIKTYNDFPKKGIAFKDVLGIIQDPEVFRELIFNMSSDQIIRRSEAIISVEARGFIFGSAIAFQASKPIILAKTSHINIPTKIEIKVMAILEEIFLIFIMKEVKE